MLRCLYDQMEIRMSSVRMALSESYRSRFFEIERTRGGRILDLPQPYVIDDLSVSELANSYLALASGRYTVEVYILPQDLDPRSVA